MFTVQCQAMDNAAYSLYQSNHFPFFGRVQIANFLNQIRGANQCTKGLDLISVPAVFRSLYTLPSEDVGSNSARKDFFVCTCIGFAVAKFWGTLVSLVSNRDEEEEEEEGEEEESTFEPSSLIGRQK